MGDNNSGKTSILEAVTYIANHTIVPFFNFENVREIGMFADLSKINLQEQKIWDNLEHLVYEKNIKEGQTQSETLLNQTHTGYKIETCKFIASFIGDGWISETIEYDNQIITLVESR